MSGKIRQAFEHVQAEEKLINDTKQLMRETIYTQSSWRRRSFRQRIPALACMMCLIFCLGFGGYRLYYTPTSLISIDINPSLELGINRFDRVVSLKGYNDDGKEVADALEVMNLKYEEALAQVLQNEKISGCIKKEEYLSIAVTGSDEKQGGRILSCAKHCTAGQKNADCYQASKEEVQKAHEEGLSLGKYRVLTELQKYEPEVTAEEVQDMTMKELRTWLAQYDPQYQSGGGHGKGKHNH